IFISRTIWKTLFLSQFLSLLICTTRIMSQYIQNYYKIYIPTAQSFLTYTLLCLIFTTWLAFRPTNKGLIHVIRVRGWKYLLLSVVDLEANFVTATAFQYTALTSIQLLDCIQLPTVLALSWLFIKVRFGLLHILGSCIALIGIGCLVWADIDDISTDTIPKNRFLGDMLCLLGAALYGISNVFEEYCVKCYSIVEFLGMIGLFGAILNGIQLYVLERHELVNAINFEKWQEISLVIGFSMSQLLVYITMPLAIQLSDSSAVNISILSSDFYTLIVGLYLFRYKFHWLYFISGATVIVGYLVYHMEPQQQQQSSHSTNDDNTDPQQHHHQQQQLHDSQSFTGNDIACKEFTTIDNDMINDTNLDILITTSDGIGDDISGGGVYMRASPAYNVMLNNVQQHHQQQHQQQQQRYHIMSVSDLQTIVHT
ncbi:solute carrier family 35 member F2-like, partial [Oppia nitens]|uniref:solute carrier family 35 member F2-like n=1 Tax=Oppia nitens TaxID=1686743 RepID=UPI0023DC06F0